MLRVDCAGAEALAPEAAALVGATVRRGGLVVYPTDTLYGLGADPASGPALAALFRLKGRAADKPVPVLLADTGLVGVFAAAVPAAWEILMEALWPGPLTLLFPARAHLLPGVRSAAGQVALRVPGSALCRSVLRAAGGALTGTSANAAGAGGTVDPGAAVRGLAGVDLLVNAGTLPPSRESTLLGIGEDGCVAVLREGAVGEGRIRRELAR